MQKVHYRGSSSAGSHSAANRLVKPSGAGITSTYNADNRRVRKEQ